MSLKKNNECISSANLDRCLRLLVGDYGKLNLIVAYSGGLDSQVLLEMLVELRDVRHFNLRAIHIHHGIHPRADEWAAFCEARCESLGVPLDTRTVVVAPRKTGVEAAARNARYTELEKHLRSASDILLTAHHQDDQAETLLLNLVRGAGVNGLAAMPAVREIGNGLLCRPLLEFSRRQLQDYAGSRQLDWIEDDSNADPEIRRSFLRRDIIPALERHWPGVKSTLALTASRMSDAGSLLAELAEADLVRCSALKGNALALPELRGLAPSRLRNVLRHWIRLQGAQMPSARQLAEIERLVYEPPVAARAIVHWGQTTALVYRSELTLTPKKMLGTVSDGAIRWNLLTGKSVCIGSTCITATAREGRGLARDRTGTDLVVRFRRGGERCRLPGREHHSSLKNIFQEHGIPPWDRRTMPLIYVDDSLAAIGDRWYCEPFAARAGEPAWDLEMSKLAEK